MAEAVGLSEAYFSKIERGDSSTTMDTLSDIADFLKVDFGQLVSGINLHSPEYKQHELFCLFDQATPQQRDKILQIVKVLLDD